MPNGNGTRDILHWWREPFAGVLALGVGVYDSWIFGRDRGLTGSLDEVLIIGGVILIAGTRRFLTTDKDANGKNENNK